MVAFKTIWCHFITMFTSTLFNHGKTIANFYTFNGINSH